MLKLDAYAQQLFEYIRAFTVVLIIPNIALCFGIIYLILVCLGKTEYE